MYDHHEDTKLFQDKFHIDEKVFNETLKNLGNPFLEQDPPASSYHVKEFTWSKSHRIC